MVKQASCQRSRNRSPYKKLINTTRDTNKLKDKKHMIIFLNWLFYLFTFLVLLSFLVSLLQTSIPPLPSASMRVLPQPPIHLLTPNCPSSFLYWGIQPSQDQEPPLPLMSDKAILCYICSWSHGSFHVYLWLVVQPIGSLGGGGGLQFVNCYIIRCRKGL